MELHQFCGRAFLCDQGPHTVRADSSAELRGAAQCLYAFLAQAALTFKRQACSKGSV